MTTVALQKDTFHTVNKLLENKDGYYFLQQNQILLSLPLSQVVIFLSPKVK